ncbi:hypothetical protein CDD81_4406 [Ophiocordyceps australis]|uniref:FAM86 N-terminal domain-containing protein n=1 Tax=Ophiocordyceps australis TaxID=1399860 RepID=A0A2C5YJC6_9HYPO|nr:hypothetical protein CDD81_4406 [Ophiocordyceps australis]
MASTLDWPQIWQKPSYQQLVKTLNGLELNPPVWRHGRRRSDVLVPETAQPDKEEVTRYLSAIIKSPLAWIDDSEQQEHIWEVASRRIAERCGRTAMGDVVRRWPLGREQEIQLVIREPALTGDLLGFKTWASSYVLAQHLPRLASASLFRLFDESFGRPAPTVLELGSGTGLLGLAAAALWKAPVVLSDLPAIVPNLKHNVESNMALVEARGGSLAVGALTWGASGSHQVDDALFGKPFQFKIVLAADALYDDNHPALLASAIGQHLAIDAEARAIVMVPERDAATTRLREALKQAMLDLDSPIFCQEQDELVGEDDWGEDDEAGRVRCWLGVFSRGGTPASAC